jgi:hypothetical protein
MEGAYLASNGQKYVVYGSRTENTTHRANLPAALDSCIPLQEGYLAVVNASRSSPERYLGTYVYLGLYKEAVEKILGQEKKAAAIQARYQQRIASKAEQQHKVSRRPHCMQKQIVLCQCRRGRNYIC